MSSWWEEVRGDGLAQGDYLPAYWIPFLFPDYGESDATSSLDLKQANLIVLTQSCDLANNKAESVTLCLALTIGELRQKFPTYQVTKHLEPLRQGRVNGLHLLAGFHDPADNLAVFVVDFRQLYNLPFGYLRRRAGQLGTRSRLKSPYLEHFSQAFARFFMRVGLPSDIPPYR